jgi:hypothetical protein
MLTTSFRLLHQAGACEDRYRVLAAALGGVGFYGRDTPITILQILAANGLDDALWALCAVEQRAEGDRFSRLLACDYAEHILLAAWDEVCPDDRRPWDAITAARRHLAGKCTKAELDAVHAAADAAADAAAAAAYAAAYAADVAAAAAAYASAYAARVARVAADAADAERAWQEDRLKEMLAAAEGKEAK